jgi:hypothetical protein
MKGSRLRNDKSNEKRLDAEEWTEYFISVWDTFLGGKRGKKEGE